jgi:glycosidase
VHKNSDGQGIVIGEVWENAAVKTAYGNRRNYFHGRQLDSVMNYPLRNGIIDFVTYGIADMLYNVLVEIYSSYPRCVSDSLMNILSTHDTERILTVLGDMYRPDAPNDHLAVMRMTAQEKETAIKRLKLASILQYTVYGIPSVFYGDEAGMEGYHDPFCRFPYPWGREDAELMAHYRMLGRVRREHRAFHGGSFRFLCHGAGYFLFEREREGDRVLVAVNIGIKDREFSVPGDWRDEVGDRDCRDSLVLAPGSCALLVAREKIYKRS